MKARLYPKAPVVTSNNCKRSGPKLGCSLRMSLPMNPLQSTRRQFFGHTAHAIGLAALGSLLNRDLFGAAGTAPLTVPHGVLKALHFAPKAKRVIYLHQSGAPSHIDL